MHFEGSKNVSSDRALTWPQTGGINEQALLDRLLPDGFAGAAVLAEIASEGWEQSPLLARFHPSVERVFEERLQMSRNLESLRNARTRPDNAVESDGAPLPEPTLEDVRREHQPRSVRQDEELTELVGQCLWDVFSYNHEVFAIDARVADIGSFHGASAFLDEYASGGIRPTWREGDCMQFYLGTIWSARSPSRARRHERPCARGSDGLSAARDHAQIATCTDTIRVAGHLHEQGPFQCHRRNFAYTGVVRVWLDLPDDIVGQLAEEGQDLSRVALEALAIDAYRTNRITAHQLCQLLEIPSRYDLDGFLKQHGVPLEYSIDDFEREGATSARLWEKRQTELPAEPDRRRRAE